MSSGIAVRRGRLEFISGRAGVKLWDLETGREAMTLPGQTGVAFSPDGRFLATIQRGNLLAPGVIALWDATPVQP